MNRKDELKSIIDKARSELRDIEDVEAVTKNKAYIGKFFKYRNSYSCPEPDEYWWLYLAVTGMSDDGNLETWNFQTDYMGQIEIETNVLKPDVSDNYIEIRPAEFWKAWDGLMAKLSSRRPTPRALDGRKSTAPAQVTQTVGRLRPESRSHDTNDF